MRRGGEPGPTARRPAAWWWLVPVAVASLVVAPWPVTLDAPGAVTARVVVFGDSLAFQAAPYFAWLVEAGGRATVEQHTFGGTNVCDWLATMRRVADTERPQAAVLEFVGNTFTPCMRGCSPGGAAAIERTCADLSLAVAVFRSVGTRVYLVGTPVTRAQWRSRDRRRDELNRRIAALAKAAGRGVRYVDAGAAVEGRGGSFVTSLPCLFFEPCNGPVVGGVREDVVRSPDGVHFCPGQSGNAVGQVGGCRGYSSGAFRFAAAMAGPVIDDLHLGRHPPRPAVALGERRP